MVVFCLSLRFVIMIIERKVLWPVMILSNSNKIVSCKKKNCILKPKISYNNKLGELKIISFKMN